MIYEDETHNRGKLHALRRENVCATCGGKLDVFLDFKKSKAYLACSADQTHEGIERKYEPTPFEKDGYRAFNIPTRREMMNKDYGDKATALEKYQGVVSLSKEDAQVIVRTLWPAAEDASPEEVFKAVTICTQYGLNPLMRHLFLVPYWNREKEKYDYVCILGINTNRLIASRKHRWSFLDDTPRISTEEEEVKHYRKVDHDKLRAIAKIRDLESGAEVTAWGEWPVFKLKDGKKVRNEPKGTDKGNSMENMACIHAERRALDMLYPADLPSEDIPVADERFGVGDIEAEYKVMHDEPRTDETDDAVEDTVAIAAADIEIKTDGEGTRATVDETAKEGKPPKNRAPSAARRTADQITPDDIPDAASLEKIAYEVWSIQPPDLWPELNYKSIRNFIEANVETAWDCFLRLKAVR